MGTPVHYVLPLVDAKTALQIAAMAVWLWPMILTGAVAIIRWKALRFRAAFLALGYLTCVGVSALIPRLGGYFFWIYVTGSTPLDSLFAATINEGLTAMVAGDFNGDGKLDLAVEVGVAGKPQQIRILLGNGDGTFQAPRVVLSNLTGFLGYPNLVVTDLNGDGVPDLLYNDNFEIGVLSGRGDGTFKNLGFLSGVTQGLAVGDFNSDGKVDLIIWDNVGSISCLRLGNGDGTFGPDQVVAVPLGSFSVNGDFDSNGLLDGGSTFGGIYLQQ